MKPEVLPVSGKACMCSYSTYRYYLLLSTVSGTRCGSWNISPANKGALLRTSTYELGGGGQISVHNRVKKGLN